MHAMSKSRWEETMATVLIVSHDGQTIYEIRCALEASGVRAMGSNSPFEAQQILASARVDLLLVDREVGAGGGAPFCDRVRALHGEQAPILLLMDRGYDPAVLAAAVSADTAGVVSKSDPLDQITERILSLLQSRPAGRWASSVPPAAERRQRKRNTDPLTGLTDRRYFTRRLQGEWAFACNQRAPMAVLMLSPDEINTLRGDHGEAPVARMLTSVARVIEGELRSRDSVSRFDRDTFAVILAETDENEARERAGRLVRLLSETRYGTVDEPLSATFSTGIAATRNPFAVSPEELARDSIDRVRQARDARRPSADAALSSAA
jgi:two-component system cell cycle response regulator